MLAGCLLLAADMAWAQSRPYSNAVQNPVPNATASPASPADGSPYYLGAAVGRGRDSNVFRLPKDLGPRSDTYTTGSVLAGVDKPIGRQRVFADVAVRRQRFNTLKELDNTGHSSSAGVDWETINNFSGQVKGTSERSLASYGSPFATTVLRERNIQTERTFGATVQRGNVRSKLQPFVAFNTRKTDYSSEAYRFRNNERKAVRAGVRYRPSDRLTLGAAAVEARGKYPFSRFNSGIAGVPDKYKSHGIEFTGDWAATGKSNLDGRIGYEQRRYDLSARNDFSGFNGMLRWRWQPTGKLTFSTSLVRDADDTDRLVPTPATELVTAASRVTNSALVEGTWAATAKVSVNANYRLSKRKLVNPTLDAGGSIQNLSGRDETRQASLGATWNATNHVSAGCNVGRESRSTDSNLSFPFKANTVNCQLTALLR
jgi:hypothetical protein